MERMGRVGLIYETKEGNRRWAFEWNQSIFNALAAGGSRILSLVEMTVLGRLK